MNGFRKRQGRGIENAYQPYSIVTRNAKERIKDSTPDMFFIGSYSLDGSLLYMQNDKVYRCSRETIIPLNEWNSFPEMLQEEVSRICALYDIFGKQINERGSTIPI